MSIEVIWDGQVCYDIGTKLTWLPDNCLGVYQERVKAHNWYKQSQVLGMEGLQCFELFFHRQATRLTWIAPDTIGLWSEVAL